MTPHTRHFIVTLGPDMLNWVESFQLDSEKTFTKLLTNESSQFRLSETVPQKFSEASFRGTAVGKANLFSLVHNSWEGGRVRRRSRRQFFWLSGRGIGCLRHRFYTLVFFWRDG